jgi:glutamate/aspartate transport system permease protein
MIQISWHDILSALPALWRGAIISLQITLVAMIVGIILGCFLALLRVSSSKPLSMLAAAYVTIFRSIPLVMVLLWFYLIAPQLLKALLHLPPSIDVRLASAFVAFSLFEAAYYAEIIRAGIQSVGRGQLNAGFALGLSYLQTVQFVILPQAIRVVTPLLVTQAIILLQDTSLVYVIGLADFFRTAVNIGGRDGTTMDMILLVGACYFAVCGILSAIVKLLRAKTLR